MSLALSSLSLNSPTAPSRLPTPTPSPPAADRPSPFEKPVQGLLIPTDRSREELEEKWLPKIGRLRVEKEVVLPGYSLYFLRTWYLSRTHWSQTIITQTGKPTEHVSAYLLVPDSSLSKSVGELELATATQFIASETRSQPRKTDYGTLLVTTPSAFGQDIFPIPGGDLREARPYMIIRTDLRRLGCGGRAAMEMESPIPAVRRKFYELYRLPTPANPNAPLSRTNSPNTSPSNTASPGATANGFHPILTDPFTLMAIELIKLIQAALALWGMFGTTRDDLEVDGLFCDETKAGMLQWRRVMGMEHEESMRLEKETSGGCIDPKTLSALLSSVTSVRYQLAALGVERLPKDPFTSIRRLLRAWHQFQLTAGRGSAKADYLDVSSVRWLNTHYLHERTRSPTDALKVHRLLFSGVAQATNSISSNLKGSGAEDTPLRKREHHLQPKTADGEGDTGVGLIHPEGNVGPVAPPDVITADLEAYTKGILKSREKDWDVMGARRVANLWHGSVAEHGEAGSRSRGILRKRPTRDLLANEEAEDNAGHGARGAFERVTARTGQALKGGFGLVSRRGTTYETSDSDTGGPGPSSLRNALKGRKQSIIPTVIEPDVEEVEEQLDRMSSPVSPSPTASHRHLEPHFGSNSTRMSLRPSSSRPTSIRPSLFTNMSNEDSGGKPRHGLRAWSLDPRASIEDRWDADRASFMAAPATERAVAWRERGRATAMLRTSSDGADVAIEENGMEWEVLTPHGTGKGQQDDPNAPVSELQRRHSLQDRTAYKELRISPAHVEHLAIDVEMCAIVLELRRRERQLASKAKELKIIEESVFKATQNIIDAIRQRRRKLEQLNTQAQQVEQDLRKTLDDADEDDALGWASKKIQFYLSEDTNLNEVMWNLRALEKDWEKVRRKVEERRRDVEEGEEKGGWWRFGQ